MVWGVNKLVEKTNEMITEKNVKESQEFLDKSKGTVMKEEFDFVTTTRKKYIYLLYGNSGSGKTYTALTFPKPLIIIDTESRADIIKDECFKGEDIKIFNPVVLPTKMTDKGAMLDYNATIDRLTNFLLKLNDKMKNGLILKTLVFDSISDLWSLVMSWGIFEICDEVNKDGKKKADARTLKFNNQMDWAIPKNKHHNLFLLMKQLTNYGVDIVFTARNKDMPDYAKELKKKKLGALYAETFADKIRCEKNIPFNVDIIVRQTLTSQNKRKTIIEKCFKTGTEETIVEDLTYEKINEVLK